MTTVGVVVLKRLADARADGDPIYAVIRGTAINNDGSGKVGYVAPSVDGQAGVIAEALGGTLAASPFLSTAVLGAAALTRFGSDAQRGAWLARMAQGEALTALAIDEGRKHAPDKVATRAERHGNGNLAAWFFSGHGVMFDSVNHFDLQGMKNQ